MAFEFVSKNVKDVYCDDRNNVVKGELLYTFIENNNGKAAVKVTLKDGNNSVVSDENIQITYNRTLTKTYVTIQIKNLLVGSYNLNIDVYKQISFVQLDYVLVESFLVKTRNCGGLNSNIIELDPNLRLSVTNSTSEAKRVFDSKFLVNIGEVSIEGYNEAHWEEYATNQNFVVNIPVEASFLVGNIFGPVLTNIVLLNFSYLGNKGTVINNTIEVFFKNYPVFDDIKIYNIRIDRSVFSRIINEIKGNLFFKDMFYCRNILSSKNETKIKIKVEDMQVIVRKAVLLQHNGKYIEQLYDKRIDMSKYPILYIIKSAIEDEYDINTYNIVQPNNTNVIDFKTEKVKDIFNRPRWD
jgi:hypothetical protein